MKDKKLNEKFEAMIQGSGETMTVDEYIDFMNSLNLREQQEVNKKTITFIKALTGK